LQSVVDVCALQPDIDNLPDGLETEIGEKGVNLSGGQKARVSLARACFADVDVVILDDPLAAVDPEVASHLFHRCLCDFLLQEEKVAVILVTHQQQFLAEAENVLKLRANGEVEEWRQQKVERTKRDRLGKDQKREGGGAKKEEEKEIVAEQQTREEGGPHRSSDSRESGPIERENARSSYLATKSKGTGIELTSLKDEVKECQTLNSPSSELVEGIRSNFLAKAAKKKRPTQLVSEEDRARGVLTWSTWKGYAKAGGFLTFSTVLLLFVLGIGDLK